MGVIRCKGTDLLVWRRELIRRGGRAVDLDWLLSMAADCSWGDLQKLRICPDVEIELSSSLHDLTDLGPGIAISTFRFSTWLASVHGAILSWRCRPTP